MTKNEKNDENINKKYVVSDAIARRLAVVALIFSAAIGGLYYNSEHSFLLQQNEWQQINKEYKTQLYNLQKELNSVQMALQNLDNTPKQIINKGISQEELSQKLSDIRQQFAAEISSLNEKHEQLAQQTSGNKHFKELLLASAALTIYDLAQNGASFAYETEVLKLLAQGDLQAEAQVEIMLQYAQGKPENKISLIADFNKIYGELNNTKSGAEQLSDEAADNLQTWYDKIWFKFKKMFIRQKQENNAVFDKTDEVYNLVNAGNLAAALNKMPNDSKYNAVNSAALSEWQKKAEAFVKFELTARSLALYALAAINLEDMQTKQKAND